MARCSCAQSRSLRPGCVQPRTRLPLKVQQGGAHSLRKGVTRPRSAHVECGQRVAQVISEATCCGDFGAASDELRGIWRNSGTCGSPGAAGVQVERPGGESRISMAGGLR